MPAKKTTAKKTTAKKTVRKTVRKTTAKKTTAKKVVKKKVVVTEKKSIVTQELIVSVFTEEKCYRWTTYVGDLKITAAKSYSTPAKAIKGCEDWLKANVKGKIG